MQERSKSMAELIQLFIYIIHICEDKLQHFAASCQLRVSGCQFQLLARCEKSKQVFCL